MLYSNPSSEPVAFRAFPLAENIVPGSCIFHQTPNLNSKLQLGLGLDLELNLVPLNISWLAHSQIHNRQPSSSS